MTAVRLAQGILISGLSVGLGACASTRLSTRDIYSELAFSGGVTCTPVADSAREQRQDEHFRDRLRTLGPWLIAQIGRAELDQMAEEYREEMESVSWTGGCPSPEEHSHDRTRRWTLLRELENRARASHFRPVVPPEAG